MIDTGCWLWSLSTPERLNKRASDFLSDRAHTLYISAASSWEIAIKATLGKLHLPEPPGRNIPKWIAAMDILGLPVEHARAESV